MRYVVWALVGILTFLFGYCQRRPHKAPQVAPARAEDGHRHACGRTTEVPTEMGCCRMFEHGKCVLRGKVLCYDRACSCGRQCSSECVTACMPE